MTIDCDANSARLHHMKNNKCVFYFRVSTQRQYQSHLGLESQKEIVTQFAQRNNFESVGDFTEVESGKKNSDERPQLAAALELCKKTGATLIVSKLDRLSRNAEFLLRLQNGNVDFVCCDAPNVDKFTVGILALVAQREREMISERTKLALKAYKARGGILGNRNPERIKKMSQAAYAAAASFRSRIFPIISEIREKAGVTTLQGIADALNARGVPTRTGKAKWYPTTVKNLEVAVSS